jgi:hypothetical protein
MLLRALGVGSARRPAAGLFAHGDPSTSLNDGVRGVLAHARDASSIGRDRTDQEAGMRAAAHSAARPATAVAVTMG